MIGAEARRAIFTPREREQIPIRQRVVDASEIGREGPACVPGGDRRATGLRARADALEDVDVAHEVRVANCARLQIVLLPCITDDRVETILWSERAVI